MKKKPKAIKTLDEITGTSSPDSTTDPSPLSSNDVIAKNMDIEKYIDDSEKFAKEYEISLIPVLRQLSVNQNFNDLEYKRFSELLNAANVLKTPLNEMSSKIKCLGDAQRVMRFVLDRDIKNIIAFTKNLKGFEMLQHPDIVKLQQYIYLYLLQRYLTVRYQSDSVLRTKFSRLMSVLSDVYFLGETQMKIVADRSPVADCSPLLKEVFNMKGQ
ncbi:unnamed protein product [Oppiella nova]|uniref:Uncharacterized protein n=1 Tax=Oppiella nova TaxID=334625 RepID=A0A7R9MAR8_9ACAR|nr:unnamed protein product [Oppiella nova]CAG2173952.1 unnamed protein product [Oppiella nova]